MTEATIASPINFAGRRAPRDNRDAITAVTKGTAEHAARFVGDEAQFDDVLDVIAAEREKEMGALADRFSLCAQLGGAGGTPPRSGPVGERDRVSPDQAAIGRGARSSRRGRPAITKDQLRLNDPINLGEQLKSHPDGQRKTS